MGRDILIVPMRKVALLTFIALLGCASPPAPPVAAKEPAQILLVRHAEKDGEDGDVPLSEEGHARARELARALADAGISAIYTSEFQRNVDTAKPLAEALGIEPVVIPADDIQVLVDRLKLSAPGSTSLVVSHQGKLPLLVRGLGAETPELTSTEYDRMVIVTLGAGEPKALTLRYGAPSEL